MTTPLDNTTTTTNNLAHKAWTGTLTIEEVKQAGKEKLSTSTYSMYGILVCTTRSCSVEIMEAILDQGVDVNMISTAGWTGLMGACNWSKWDIVRLLLQRGANPTHVSVNKQNALHFAAERDAPEDIITSLIEYGVDPTFKDEEGKTAADLARMNDSPDIASYIEQFYQPTKSANFIA
jgi:ankyrin repeat protein